MSDEYLSQSRQSIDPAAPLFLRVFSYCDPSSKGAEIAAPKRVNDRELEYGEDTSSQETNPLKWLWARWYHWSWRKWVFQTLSYPETNSLAVYISIFMIGIVLLSSTSFVIETVDDMNTPFNQAVFSAIEIFAIVCFTSDYGLRLLCCPNVWKFVKDPMNIIDLAAIVPYFVFAAMANSKQGGQSRIVRILSLFRILRLLKLGNRFQNLQVRYESLYRLLPCVHCASCVSCAVEPATCHFAMPGQRTLPSSDHPRTGAQP